MHRCVYESLKVKPKLHSRKGYLQSVNGDPLTVDGWAEVPFEVAGIKMSHPFYIVRNMNRKVILGRCWLEKNGVRIYYDVGCIRVNMTYIPMQKDIQISSIERAKKKTKIKQQTACIFECMGKKP